MIGVIYRKHQKEIVEEFFELFKTPWEPWREDASYDVVLTTDPDAPIPHAKLVIAFGTETTRHDRRNGFKILSLESRVDIEWEGSRIPIYGQLATFEEPNRAFLNIRGGKVAGLSLDLPGCKVLRIGYDLFDEIDHLLRRGQPVEQARVPTLELQIAMLRKWILDNDIPLVEIPPSPHGYDFITCLTHDIDFMEIRAHRFDHSVLGFAYRSVIPKYLKGLDRKTARARYLKNIKSLLSLPFIHVGLLPDIWYPLDRYSQVEKDLKSTFFFIPFKDHPGEAPDGGKNRYRAARYDICRYKEPIRCLTRHGCEVGLHGIDAWRDPWKGREELEVIRRITGEKRIGVRMHWLYFSDETPRHLEEAGAYYDSTLGYNEAVGYRSGTTQVFRLPGNSRIFELPLHVQDTAMLYPGRMGLSEHAAIDLCGQLIGDMKTHGGVFTLNWHDRSMSPERNWDDAYLAILGILTKERTWFATAGAAVAWFEKRRTVRFEDFRSVDGLPKGTLRTTEWMGGPPLTIRVNRPMTLPNGERESQDYCVDLQANSVMRLSEG